MGRPICAILLFFVAMNLAAAERETFVLRDGRHLVGVYDAEKGVIVMLVGTVSAQVVVKEGDIVERHPAPAESTSPLKPAQPEQAKVPGGIGDDAGPPGSGVQREAYERYKDLDEECKRLFDEIQPMEHRQGDAARQSGKEAEAKALRLKIHELWKRLEDLGKQRDALKKDLLQQCPGDYYAWSIADLAARVKQEEAIVEPLKRAEVQAQQAADRANHNYFSHDRKKPLSEAARARLEKQWNDASTAHDAARSRASDADVARSELQNSMNNLKQSFEAWRRTAHVEENRKDVAGASGPAFDPVDLPFAITGFDMSEDGTQIAAASKPGSKVIILDVLTSAINAAVDVDDPAFVLFRGGTIIVLDSTSTKVRVLAQRPTWRQVDEITLPKRQDDFGQPYPRLFAGRGSAFGDVVVVSEESRCVIVDLHARKAKAVIGTQQLKGLSADASRAFSESQVYDGRALLNGKKEQVDMPDHWGLESRVDDVCQLAPNAPWFYNGTEIGFGNPPTMGQYDPGLVCIPDAVDASVHYLIGDCYVEARSSAAGFKSAGLAASTLTAPYASKDPALHYYRVLSRGAAATIAGKLVIFLPLIDRSLHLHRAEFPAFVAGRAAAKDAAPTGTPSKPADQNATRRTELATFSELSPGTSPSKIVLSEDGTSIFLIDPAKGIDVVGTRDGKPLGHISATGAVDAIERSGVLLIAERGAHRVSVFDATPPFARRREVVLPADHEPTQVAAPQRQWFEGAFIVVAAITPPKPAPGMAPEQHMRVLAMDEAGGWGEVVLGSNRVRFESGYLGLSVDGTKLVVQNGLNISPRFGSFPVLGLSEIVAGAVATEIGRSASQDNPFIEQVPGSRLWFGGNAVFGGSQAPLPVATFGLEVVPDLLCDAFYVLTDSAIEAREVGGAFGVIGRQACAIPDGLADAFASHVKDGYVWKDSPGTDDSARCRAVTLGDTLAFILHDPVKRRAWMVRMPAFRPGDGALAGAILAPRVGDQFHLGRAVVGRPFSFACPAGASIAVERGPDGLRANGGIISWTPSNAQAGFHEVHANVTSSGTTRYTSLVIEVLTEAVARSAEAAGKIDAYGLHRLDGAVRSVDLSMNRASLIINGGKAL